jgi:acyl-CoA synthetase (AMP-forming)/AMP-acid ligase II
MNVGVVGKKDIQVGEFPIAFVVLKEPLEQADKVLKNFCAHYLATYKIPRQIIILPEMPVTSLRKVDKKRLRKEYLGQMDK